MKLIIVLLFIGFIELEVRGKNIHGDPAPGRSPGPPSSLIGDIYSIDASHESYQPPTLVLTQQQQQNQQQKGTSTVSSGTFRDIFTSTSSENVEYHYDVNDDNNQIANHNSNQNLPSIDEHNLNGMTAQLQQFNDELALKALKDSLSSFPQKRQQPLTVQTRSKFDNTSDTVSDIKNKRMDRCNLGVTSSRIFNYLKLGDKIIEMDFNYSKRHKTLTQHESSTSLPVTGNSIVATSSLQLDVIHDVFDTSMKNGGGLLQGIVYKGELVLPKLAFCS